MKRFTFFLATLFLTTFISALLIGSNSSAFALSEDAESKDMLCYTNTNTPYNIPKPIIIGDPPPGTILPFGIYFPNEMH